MKINIPENDYEVPDGEKCYSWSDDDGGWQKVKCQFYKNDRDYVSTKEAITSGLGYSGGYIDHHICTLFRAGLSSKRGVGVFKCDECKKAGKQHEEER